MKFFLREKRKTKRMEYSDIISPLHEMRKNLELFGKQHAQKIKRHESEIAQHTLHIKNSEKATKEAGTLLQNLKNMCSGLLQMDPSSK